MKIMKEFEKYNCRIEIIDLLMNELRRNVVQISNSIYILSEERTDVGKEMGAGLDGFLNDVQNVITALNDEALNWRDSIGDCMDDEEIKYLDSLSNLIFNMKKHHCGTSDSKISNETFRAIQEINK